jgi:hypothetical protein
LYNRDSDSSDTCISSPRVIGIVDVFWGEWRDICYLYGE